VKKEKMKILLVDDEMSMLALIKRTLEKREFTVVTASSGEEALVEFKKGGFDLVLLDINMEGFNGIQTLKKMKEFNSGALVIMLTGAHDEKIAKKCFALGANNFLTKPFNEQQFDMALTMSKFLNKNVDK